MWIARAGSKLISRLDTTYTEASLFQSIYQNPFNDFITLPSCHRESQQQNEQSANIMAKWHRERETRREKKLKHLIKLCYLSSSHVSQLAIVTEEHTFISWFKLFLSFTNWHCALNSSKLILSFFSFLFVFSFSFNMHRFHLLFIFPQIEFQWFWFCSTEMANLISFRFFIWWKLIRKWLLNSFFPFLSQCLLCSCHCHNRAQFYCGDHSS